MCVLSKRFGSEDESTELFDEKDRLLFRRLLDSFEHEPSSPEIPEASFVSVKNYEKTEVIFNNVSMKSDEIFFSFDVSFSSSICISCLLTRTNLE